MLLTSLIPFLPCLPSLSHSFLPSPPSPQSPPQPYFIISSPIVSYKHTLSAFWTYSLYARSYGSIAEHLTAMRESGQRLHSKRYIFFHNEKDSFTYKDSCSICHLPFYIHMHIHTQLDISLIAGKVSDWLEVCSKLEQTLPTDPVLQKWKERLTELHKNIPLLQQLSLKALRVCVR